MYRIINSSLRTFSFSLTQESQWERYGIKVYVDGNKIASGSWIYNATDTTLTGTINNIAYTIKLKPEGSYTTDNQRIGIYIYESGSSNPIYYWSWEYLAGETRSASVVKYKDCYYEYIGNCN